MIKTSVVLEYDDCSLLLTQNDEMGDDQFYFEIRDGANQAGAAVVLNDLQEAFSVFGYSLVETPS